MATIAEGSSDLIPPNVFNDEPESSTDPMLTPHNLSSGQNSPILDNEVDGPVEPSRQKKKKKKKKKQSKVKETLAKPLEEPRPPVLCISRNKHWKYISSYHGPWLQLPVELLESLLVLNCNPASPNLPLSEARSPALPSPTCSPVAGKSRDRGFESLSYQHSPPDSPRTTFKLVASSAFPAPKPGRAPPPPIDPGVFRSMTEIRRLVDEAAELSVRASSGLTAAALGSLRSGGSVGGNNNMAYAFGFNPSGETTGGGRNVAMSAMRQHRLRVMAVQKLAQAYKLDEIASSVMVMQGGSVFDDIAERVLKTDPSDADAKYVHFFHEKIPSRQLAESTSTQVLNELIAAQPQRLEFYRTRGIVHSFRDEYQQASRDFTYALKEVRAARRARAAHRIEGLSQSESSGRGGKRKKAIAKSNGQAPPSGTSTFAGDPAYADGQDAELPLHPSVLLDAPEPIELQLLFLRGAAFLQHAVFLIEGAILKLEGITKVPSADGSELRLCYIDNGKYGGVEIGHPDGPLGKKDGIKMKAYRKVLTDAAFREQAILLIKKSMRDYERFLSHFDILEGPNFNCDGDLASRIERAFTLSESCRPGHHPQSSLSLTEPPLVFTTYHPLLVETHFSLLICQLMLGEFTALAPSFIRTAALVDGLEGYPVFLPPRSMAQAEFVEVLERLASGWKNGVQPRSHPRVSSGKLAIEAPPLPQPQTPIVSSAGELYLAEHDPHAPSTSAAAAAAPQSGGNATGANDFATPIHASPLELAESLDCLRVLLAPVAKRRRQRAEKAAAEKSAGPSTPTNNSNGKKTLQINIPLHGPRVEIILAWLAAVHLVELDSVT